MVLSLLEVLIISQSPAALNCRERYNLGILFHCIFFSPDAKEEQEKNSPASFIKTQKVSANTGYV